LFAFILYYAVEGFKIKPDAEIGVVNKSSLKAESRVAG
jgi:hypothetical protein